MMLGKKTSVIFLRKLSIFVVLLVCFGVFFTQNVEAQVTESYVVVSGVDKSSGAAEDFSADEIVRLGASDSEPGSGVDRVRSDKWPDENVYDENRYIEFVFTPAVPLNAIISEVKITHEFQRSAALAGAKIEVWDGDNFVEVTGTTLGTIGEDHTDILNAISILNTPEKINNTKVRFLAYRATPTVSGTTTGHDFVELSVSYDLPEIPSEEFPEEEIEDLDTEEDLLSDFSFENDFPVGVFYEIPYKLFDQTRVVCDVPPYNISINFGSYQIAQHTANNVLFKTNTTGNGACTGSFNAGTVGFGNFGSGLQSLNGSPGVYYLILYLERDYKDPYGYMAFDCFVNAPCLPLRQTPTSLLPYSGVYTEDMIWTKEGGPYLVDQMTLINGAILTIEPGAVIKFMNKFSNITLGSRATINANGTEEDKIYFTSIKDDSVSGDTNRDGNVSSPLPGSWHYLKFNYNSFGNFTNIILKNSASGIFINDGKVIVSNSEFFDNKNYGLLIINGRADVSDSYFHSNDMGIYQYLNATTSVRNNSFANNTNYGIYSYSYPLDARENYWGDPSGPYHETLNPEGLGQKVSNNVIFEPWLLTWGPEPEPDPEIEEEKEEPEPTEEVCEVDCFSNVMFLPGFQASRLYEEFGDCIDELSGDDPFCEEKELWISLADEYHKRLYLNSNGDSIYNIYTKPDTKHESGESEEEGLLDKAFGISNIYRSFIEDLQDWKSEKIINDYDFVPYDWRLALEDVITNGHVEGGKLSYLGDQDFSESFMLKRLEDLAKSSKSEKVTLVAHSNGGLVAKALIQKLKDTGSPLYEKIDKVILVAVPQVGTPLGAITILHGLKLGKGFVMNAERSRDLAENMPGIYNLIPSEEYFSTVYNGPDYLVEFEDDSLLQEYLDAYGTTIDNASELERFILGLEGRDKPAYEDTKNPNIGNSALYDNAVLVHDILDNWQPYAETKVIQVAGWGEMTKAYLEYKVYRSLFGKDKISYKIREVVDGDSTVVLPSALWMEDGDNVERWWVDLENFNKGITIFPIQHKDILEIEKLRDFIFSEIIDTNFSDSTNVVLPYTLIPSSGEPRLYFHLHSPLTLGILDSQGRYTGLDKDTGEIRQELPGARYNQVGEVQYISVPYGLEYTLVLYGVKDGSFALDIDKQIGNEIVASTSFQAVPSYDGTKVEMDISPLFEVGTGELSIDFDGDGKIDHILTATEDGITIYEELEEVKEEEATPNTQTQTVGSGTPAGAVNIFLTNSNNSTLVAQETQNEQEEIVEVEEVQIERNIENQNTDVGQEVTQTPIGSNNSNTNLEQVENTEEAEDTNLTATALDTGIDFDTNTLFIISLLSLLLGLGFKFVKL